mgnify:CR=1 FL=1
MADHSFLFQYCQTYQSGTSAEMFYHRNDCRRYCTRYRQTASPLNVIVGAIVLIAINGGLIYGVIFLRQYTVKGIPIMFIAAPVVFIIELLALLVHNGGSDEDEEEIESDSDTADVNAAKSAGEGEHSDIHKEPVQGETMDWGSTGSW